MSELRRIVAGGKRSAKEWEWLIESAAQNGYEALVISLGEKSLWKKINQGKGIFRIAEHCHMVIEAGGWDFSLLLPRKKFFSHRDLFRMEHGRRTAKYHFCPTNPATTEIIKKESAKLFSRVTNAAVFHLWPDKGHEKEWCACPACRAFSPAEQNRIAINSAASVLARIAPQAQLCYLEIAEEAEEEDTAIPAGSITPAQNVFSIRRAPDKWKDM